MCKKLYGLLFIFPLCLYTKGVKDIYNLGKVETTAKKIDSNYLIFMKKNTKANSNTPKSIFPA